MFWFRLLRLLGSVLVEAAANGLRLVLFPFERHRVRARIRGLMCSERRRAVVLLGILSLVPLLAGCTQFPGSSFRDQVDEFAWSAKTVVSMPDWKESLWEDIRLVTDPEPGALKESLEMLGW